MTEKLPEEEAAATALHQALVMEELIRANKESKNTMLSLVERVREETKARDRKVDALEKAHKQVRWVTALIIILILILIVMGVINAVNLNSARRSQRQVAEVAAQAQQTNRTLLDCINSTGACGKANSAAQRTILDQVKLYNLTTSYCLRVNPVVVDPRGEKFIDCVNKLYPDGPQLKR